MLSTSAEFTTAVSATVRKPKARVTITWTDSYIDTTVVVTPNEENRVNYPDQIANESFTIPHTWAHLDATTKLLNDMHPAPGIESDDYEMGWWGENRCAANGDFSVPYPAVSVSFAARAILKVIVAGDDAWGEYPEDFTIAIYNGITLLTTISVTGNTTHRWMQDVTSLDITSATLTILTITKWSTGSRVVKISEFYDAIETVYDGDEIVEMNIIEEREIKDATIPIGNISANEIELKLNNVDDKFFPGNTDSIFHHFAKKGRKIVAELGFQLPDDSIEYVPMGTYWSGDWQMAELGTTASTSARDVMEHLRKTIFNTSDVYDDYTLTQLATLVLDDAKLELEDLEYSIDSDLDNYVVPLAYFDRCTHFEAIRLIVEACRGQAYADRDGVVQVLGPDEPTDSPVDEITSDDYFQKDQPANSEEIVNQVNVEIEPIEPESAPGGNVYTSKDDISIGAGDVVVTTCKYSDVPVIDAVASLTGASTAVITDIAYYAWGAIITVFSASIDTYKISILGRSFSVVGKEVVTSEDADSQLEFHIQEYTYKDNHLIQSRDIAALIADGLLDAYKLQRKDALLDWRGNPAYELGDPITVPDYVKGTIDETSTYYITRMQHAFDGTYKMNMEARKIDANEPPEANVYQDTDGVATVLQDTDGVAVLIQG